MKKLFVSFLFLILSFSAVAQQPAAKGSKSASGLPPIIDRELFFGNPEITGAQISPDGKYISFVKPWNDTRNIYVKGVDEPFSAARLLTTETKRPIPGWTRGGKCMVYVKDNDGNENYNIFAVDPAAKSAPGRRLLLEFLA